MYNFKASNSWLERFKKRHNLVYRCKSNSCVLPKEKIIEKTRILDERICMALEDKGGANLNGIANMDQTNIQFGKTFDSSLDFKGRKDILIKKSKFEKITCTIVLCCTTDGTLLNPLIVFKEQIGRIGPTVSKKITVPDNIIVTGSKSGWTRNVEIKYWFDTVWAKSKYKDDHLLLMDSYPCHTSKETTNYISQKQHIVGYLPSNCTNLFQPLDVTVNKVFKDKLKHHLYENENNNTYGTNFRQAIIDAVVFARADVSSKLIQKGFEKSNLSHYF